MSLCPHNTKPVTIKTAEIFFSRGIERTVLYQPIFNTERQTHEKEIFILDKIWGRTSNNTDGLCTNRTPSGKTSSCSLSSQVPSTHKSPGKTVSQMGMSPTATNSCGEKYYKYDSEGVFRFLFYRIYSQSVLDISRHHIPSSFPSLRHPFNFQASMSSEGAKI